MNFLFRLLYRIYRLQWHITRPTVVGVRLILIENAQVLLVRHTYQHHWYFPGGAVKRGELTIDAARREANEEAGVTLTAAPTILGLYASFYEGKNDHIAVFFSHEFTVGKRLDRWEIADCCFFPLNALPTDLSPACARRLTEYQRGPGPYIDWW
ncbi:MAG: NUDIX domain-containing protein [Caldilineaceae bacterium]